MPKGLRRFQQCGQLHFITFSCYHRRPRLSAPSARTLFEQALERTRRSYRFVVCGYVVMPEHVHMLVSEPERAALATAIQALKQSLSRRLAPGGEAFWQARYYDFNVFSAAKRTEKLRYMHRNPVTRGLVEKPEEWPWSSFRHYLTGVEGNVEIESAWTARKRERLGVGPTVRINSSRNVNRPALAKEARTGHPDEYQ